MVFKKSININKKDNISDHFVELKTMQGLHKSELSQLQEQITRLWREQEKELHQQRSRFDQHQQQSMQLLQQGFTQSIAEIRSQMMATLNKHTETLNQNIRALTQDTHAHLKQISEQVDQRLNKGFEKTTQTFQSIIERLAIIDTAQQKITELSSNVVSLQEILVDKRSRGAFGEVQLNHLISNLLPSACYALQYALSNEKRVDCMLFLPKPTGHLAVDAKFPLESYQKVVQDPSNRQYQAQFKTDLKKHIKDIASKYIIPGETADGAIMFIPAEAIFAEIHANHPDIVALGQQHRVWLASPTTMMAILTTARAALKDAETREQVHLIQHHLMHLSKDFDRFKLRMNNLSRHIKQAHQDVEQVNISSRQITDRFTKIEKVELQELDTPLPDPLNSVDVTDF